ncbi:hypothetical protein K7X08_038054 [Anisodus acutangulus]|uniref:GRF-type domain-containing protein n=1 Tax=Anisodus acutangulus TaxID=402998 RepID=A0A9Q1N1H6_9SOLA|nr:hypothetical protein K7X08_038054 [Anisodus acutangulus]
MSASSSVSSPQQVQSCTCKCGLIVRHFTATTPENDGCRFYKCRRPGSNFCGYWDWIDDKLPPHVSIMIHNKKSESDSIQKEINHLKKLVEDMGGNDSELKDMAAIEIFYLKKVSTSEDKMSNLELKNGIESSNLKKVETLGVENAPVDKLASDILDCYCWFCNCQDDLV